MLELNKLFDEIRELYVEKQEIKQEIIRMRLEEVIEKIKENDN